LFNLLALDLFGTQMLSEYELYAVYKNIQTTFYCDTESVSSASIKFTMPCRFHN